MSIARLSRFVLSHKLVVVVAWIVIVGISVGSMSQVFGSLSDNFDLPGAESTKANTEIMQNYGNGAYASPHVPVVTLPEGTTVDSPGVRDDLNAVFTRITDALPNARVVSWATTGDRAFVSDDGRTTFGLVFMPMAGEGAAGLSEIQQAVAGQTVGGAPVYITGRTALSTISEDSGGGSGVLIETLVGAGGALIVLLYIFGSLLAILPLIIAGVSILTTFLLIGLTTNVIDINTIVQYVVALIGLGIAIDYALLVVTRWREERSLGATNTAAVQTAMESAGHAVLFSGTTVGIGLLAMVALPIPFMRGLGVGSVLIPIVSVIVTLTLLPVILATVGPKLDRIGFRRARQNKPENHRGWMRWGTLIVRNRWLAAAIGLILLVALMIPATQLTMGEPRPDALNGSGDALLGLEALEASGIDAGVTNPFEVVVHADGNAVQLATAISSVDGVRGAVAPTGDSWNRDDTSLVVVLPQNDGGGEANANLIDDARAVTHQQAGSPYLGGYSAAGADLTDRIYGNFPLMLAGIAIVTYILLVHAFRSLLLPLKALLLNVLSVAASYGVLVLVWQYGWGSNLIWGIPATGSITEWVPLMTFAFLFGLSMDYEVFIIHRMREEYDRSQDTDGAIVRGLAHTGKLVTCAALILFLAFVAMASTPATEIKIMATGLAAGIIIDATIIRALLVPALTSLMGHWNWWLPSWLGWLAAAPTGASSHRIESEPAR